MKMYAIRPAEDLSSAQFSEAVSMLVNTLDVDKLEVMCREVEKSKWPYDVLNMPKDAGLLSAGLKFLSDDLGFFTLSSSGKLLIIPFEGKHFNIVTNDDVMLTAVSGIETSDVTEVLQKYSDLYEGFGLYQTFKPQKQ